MKASVRKTLPVDGLWRFAPDCYANGNELGFHEIDHDDRFWKETPVPACFETSMPDIDCYEGMAWYRKRLSVPPEWRGQRIVLRFEGVNYRTRVWLNGKLVGENYDGFLPFEFEIQDHVLWDNENFLAISVDNSHHEGDVPGMHVGWRNYGGILREVSLYTTSFLYIRNIIVDAEPQDGGGGLKCILEIQNRTDTLQKTACEVSLRDSNNDGILLHIQDDVEIQAGKSKSITLAGHLDGARLWSPSSPVLYRAAASLKQNSRIRDNREVLTGFRSVQATPEGLALNGQSIFLTGFNRHEDSPRTGMATDLVTARKDLEQMKKAGCNFVRLCHYPHHPKELDICDELGLLTFCEIPLYCWNNQSKGGLDVEGAKRSNAARTVTAKRQLERLIGRDRNHPSVIFWSVSNETPEEIPEVAESNRKLVRHAREIDSKRLCVHVSNRWKLHPNFDDDDVICINGYPSLVKTRKHDASDVRDVWRKGLENLHARYPDKPILITEFGFCSFTGLKGHDMGENEHAQAIETEFATFDQPYVCGATIWCWADHPWPPRMLITFRGLGVSPYGVVNRARHQLKPFRTARALFRAKQGMDAIPSANRAKGDQIIMIRPHLDDIPTFQFPPGFKVRPMTKAHIGLWTDIQRDAEPYLSIQDDTFALQFGDDLEAIQWRCFIVTDPDERGVGVMSAWYNRDFQGRDHGRIHWIAIRPAYQGMALGKAALSYAMHKLAEWHERAYLVTNAKRTAAVKLYLNFGFEPDLTPPGALENWQCTTESLRHPLLERALKDAEQKGIK